MCCGFDFSLCVGQITERLNIPSFDIYCLVIAVRHCICLFVCLFVVVVFCFVFRLQVVRSDAVIIYYYLSFLPQNRSRGQLLSEITCTFCEEVIKQGKNPRKILKRSNWLPIGASR